MKFKAALASGSIKIAKQEQSRSLENILVLYLRNLLEMLLTSSKRSSTELLKNYLVLTKKLPEMNLISNPVVF